MLLAALVWGGESMFAWYYREDSSAVQFKNAIALSIDIFNNVYVLDAGSNEIVKLTPNLKLLRRIGGYGWKSGELDQPKDIASPNGLDVFVADYGNHRVLRFDKDLNLQTSTSSSDEVEGANKLFGYPRSIALSRFGSLFIIDSENKRIVKFSNDQTLERTFGNIHGGKGSLASPERIRISGNDRVYIQDQGQIVIFDIFGNYVKTLSKNLFQNLRTFAVDDKNLYVLDGCTIVIFDEGGNLKSKSALRVDGTGISCSSIVDFQVRNGIAYLLTRQMFTVHPIADSLK